MTCINVTGLIEYQIRKLREIPEGEIRVSYLQAHARQTKRDYCDFNCERKPLCDFYRRYPAYQPKSSGREIGGSRL